MPPRSERTLSVGSTNTLSRAFDKFADVTDTVKEYCPRIRILVMGRRNAGKTTLLQRMAGSSDGQVFIRSSEGELIDSDTILQPSVERGRSHIEYEITYPSDEDYVFHDSRGMEAGSEIEIKTLNEFIEGKQKKKILAQRLHVIWLCLPVDNDRPLGPHEMAFFNHGTEGVPVIAVFTKFEWRVTKAFGQLRDDGKSIAQARKEAPAKARQDFEVIQNERFVNVRHKPAYYVYLKEMDQPSGSFDELTESTKGLVLNEVYQQLFLQIKHGDIKITMAIALVHAIVLSNRHEFAVGAHGQLREWTIFLLSLFPYWDNHLKVKHHWNWNFAERQFKLAVEVTNPSTPSVDLVVQACTSWVDPNFKKGLQLLTYFVDVLMIAEHSFWFEDKRPWEHIGRIISNYGSCPQRQSIRPTVDKLFKAMNHPYYQHTAFGLEGPLQSPKLRELAIRYTPSLLDHRFLSVFS